MPMFSFLESGNVESGTKYFLVGPLQCTGKLECVFGLKCSSEFPPSLAPKRNKNFSGKSLQTVLWHLDITIAGPMTPFEKRKKTVN